MTETQQSLKPPRYPWIGKKPFYGWIIVSVGAVTQFFQGIASQGFTTYMGLLQAEFGWTKAALSGPRSVTQIEGAITGPLEGFLVDRFGPRKVAAAGIFISGIGFALFGLMNSYVMFYISSIVITLGIGLQGLLVLSVTVNNWFNRKRTIAQSFMGLGYSMAGVIGVPLLVFLQKQMDWRASAYITAAFVWVVGFPFVMMLRDKPEAIGSIPDGIIIDKKPGDTPVITRGYDYSLSESLKTSSFWLLAIGQAISNLGILGAQLHLFLHLEEYVGIERETVALVWTVASLSNIPARLLGGYFGDRFPKNVLLGISNTLMAGAVYILAVTDSTVMAFTFAVIFGIGWGMRTPVLNAIQGEYFGRTSQGIIRGWMQSLGLPIIIAAPVIVGHMADVQGTYLYAFSLMAGVMMVGSILLLIARHPKPPSSASELYRES
ncbi:MAG: MFS transporter [Dehalococcoidales bacterium]|nr:MFS transporter [Dehalococcoidales bacterium]